VGNHKYTLLIVALLLFFGVEYYWTTICVEGECSYEYMSNIWLPLKQSGLYMGLILAPFIFLPTHYFSAYFKKVFWWLVLLGYVVVAANGRGSDLWFDRTDTVYIMGGLSIVITLVFLLLHYRGGKKEEQT
jgi:hypothetical protein